MTATAICGLSSIDGLKIMAGINFTCACGKVTRIEIPEITELRRRVVQLEKRISDLQRIQKPDSGLDALRSIFGMK
jgi:hypothetical protein